MIAPAILAPAMVTMAAPMTAAVPATAWRCRLSDSAGTVSEVSGRIPELPKGRDPNRSVFAEMTGTDGKQVVGITGEPGGEWMRDYQLSGIDGGETVVLNLKLRKGTAGVAYLTRFGDAERKALQPYRYVSAGLCTADFDPPAGRVP